MAGGVAPGASADRLGEVMASARNRPVFTCCADATSGSIISCTWPEIRSVIATHQLAQRVDPRHPMPPTGVEDHQIGRLAQGQAAALVGQAPCLRAPQGGHVQHGMRLPCVVHPALLQPGGDPCPAHQFDHVGVAQADAIAGQQARVEQVHLVEHRGGSLAGARLHPLDFGLALPEARRIHQAGPDGMTGQVHLARVGGQQMGAAEQQVMVFGLCVGHHSPKFRRQPASRGRGTAVAGRAQRRN